LYLDFLKASIVCASIQAESKLTNTALSSGEQLDGYTHEEAAEALKRRSNHIVLRVVPAEQ